ncbi:hypothetical protein F5X68DRAFT_254237 [Plectosphaerella plurivora]|uniref:Zn(2)-C6 fungal-type domain-containing protein n=1 Tax=Plectosphaerella plurivora TaxID=936078 RepID=A0A9P8VFA4_9PEZI|nr:hypothetical protein F5X68DRAFT_254237 [Plectosphaerella plurivora]
MDESHWERMTLTTTDRIRRQNHSCDHCRRSKKACDGYMINEAAHGSPLTASYAASSGAAGYEPLPCSYCVRTKKQCSTNPYWRRPKPPTVQDEAEMAADWGQNTEPKRQRTDQAAFPRLELTSEELAHVFQVPDLNSLPWNMPPPGPNTTHVQSLFDLAPASLSGMDPALSGHGEAAGYLPHDLELDASDSMSYLTSDAFSAPLEQINPEGPEDNSQATLWSVTQEPLSTPASMLSGQALSFSEGGNRRRRRISQYSENATGYQPSISTADSWMMTDSNNLIISDSLLRIYHDVLENNLACWLAEENCPYKMVRFRGAMMTIPSSAEEFGVSEWGTSWTNRLYRRVMQLDRAAQKAKTIRLTRDESQAASRALDLAIMAFATQFAQGSRRRERFRTAAVLDDAEDAFEQTMQQNIWRQARQALSQVADLESYRVVYAELIFGLTEKPWVEDDFPEGGGTDNESHVSALPEILEAIAQSGPPVYLDRAAKKVQTLRHRFEANETAAACKGRTRSEHDMAQEDRRTIGLLYWLAVMFDTVSSSMNERPVALADEECEQDVVHERRSSQSSTDLEASRSKWEVDIFAPPGQSGQVFRLSWPCSYDVATAAISRSAPIKILIFRHLSYFQNVLRRKEFGQPTESAIRGAMMVYRYWNTTYSSFYRDLVQHYDSTPTRIRSWFVCIYIPWHLASIMLSEMIDFVDDNGLGTEQCSNARRASIMASRMRRSSAMALSDLARVTTPEDTVQLPGYHFAVEEGPLMTEPWTVILVRAFTKTALFHLEEAEDLRRHDLEVLGQSSDELQDSVRRAEDCARALWSLGKKSQTARHISNILSAALERM